MRDTFAAVAIILQCRNVSTQHARVKLPEWYMPIISEFRKKCFVCARSPSAIFTRKNKNEYKILAALANSTTGWQQVTSGGIALHPRPAGAWGPESKQGCVERPRKG